ncbi:MAG: alpha/beta hydrolase [Candidatus Kerfeldbacteria bacterium]|nr:alpha/beta hydrolase [Candidatus Kerfeldbacteria bacterium]
MVKKKCIIIHGCPSDDKDPSYNKHWIPWIKKNLIANNIETETPLMPLPWQPDYEKFKTEFEKYVVDENTILIGHSCGCSFLVRWLGETKKHIAKLILVAPWKIPQGKRKGSDRDFYTYPIDATIQGRVNKIILFTANNEKEDGKKSLDMYHEALGGEIINLQGRGHYCLDDMGTEEFPELLEKILQ